jgi:hypothetical protein
MAYPRMDIPGGSNISRGGGMGFKQIIGLAAAAAVPGRGLPPARRLGRDTSRGPGGPALLRPGHLLGHPAKIYLT